MVMGQFFHLDSWGSPKKPAFCFCEDPGFLGEFADYPRVNIEKDVDKR
jgi:hypothetical protein